MKALILLAFLCPLFSLAAADSLQEAEDLRLADSESLSQAAGAKDPLLRARAAVAYGRIMSAKGIDPLLRLSADPKEKVREAAVFALGQLGWQAEASHARRAELLAALGKILLEKSIPVRVAAVEAIGKLGQSEAVALLNHSLSSKTPAVRAAAVMAIFRARMIQKIQNPDQAPGQISAELLDRFLRLASDHDPLVRRNVAYFFARNADLRAEATVARLSREKDKFTRTFAFHGLAKMKSKSTKPDSERGLHDAEPSARLAALSALVAAEENLLPHAALEKDKSFHVRALFAQALDGSKSVEAQTILERMLKNDPSLTVRAEALKTLAKAKGEATFSWLTEQCASKEWQLREACVGASEDFSSELREMFLLALMKDESPYVRVAALEALGTLPGPAAFRQIQASLESPQLAERATAVSALKERKEKEMEVLELAWKTYQASQERKWVEAREELLEIFIKNKSEATTGYLKQMLEDPARSVRAKAKQALLSRGVAAQPESPEPPLSRSPHRDARLQKNPHVEIVTNRGSFTVECFAKDAPIHVADFVGHVKEKFYDGLLWHLVISNFVIQGGDPDGSGFGDAGYNLRAEINTQPFELGSLGMPRSQGFDTGGGQLFFNHVPTPHLDGQYTVFGKVVKGLEVLDLIERGDKIVRARLLK